MRPRRARELEIAYVRLSASDVAGRRAKFIYVLCAPRILAGPYDVQRLAGAAAGARHAPLAIQGADSVEHIVLFEQLILLPNDSGRRRNRALVRTVRVLRTCKDRLRNLRQDLTNAPRSLRNRPLGASAGAGA